MKISLNWLREFVNIPKDADTQKLSTLFTIRTAEVEGAENQAAEYDNIVVGQILEIHPHPNADKLRITKTSVGKETLQIVCGGTNLSEGQFVAVAKIGAKVKWHGEGELVTIQETKIRSVESFGMICAGEEIGVEQTPGEGGERPILDLSPLNPQVGMNLAELLEKDDTILTVDNKSLTHRPDLWGHYGIAREVAAIIDEKLKPLKSTVKFPTNGESYPVEVADPDLCPRYIGVKLTGIKIESSPSWMQKRLRSVGYRPINNIVDVTNYVMAELGQPLHAFDVKKLDKGIVVRRAKESEKITTLDGVERKLSKEMLVIADHQKPVAIAGVMGGNNSEVDDSTTEILLEAATFHPSSVRKTSVKLGLRTEAVQRFEKSLDPNLAETAANRACELILQICPTAAIAGPKTDVKNFDEKNLSVQVNLSKVFSKIGVEIPTKKVIDILEKLEFEAEELPELRRRAIPEQGGPENRLKVKVPSFRATKDISIEDDLVEEVARMYGYENIQPLLPELPIKLPMQNHERIKKHEARKILAYGLGFNEVYNYSFYSLNDIHKNLLPEELHIKVQNCLSEDQTHLRISLIPNLLKNVAENLKHTDNFRIFEIGRTYEDLQEYFPKEEKKICGVIVLNKKTKGDVFYEAKGALETFLATFRIPGLEMRKGESLCPYAHPNRYAGWYLKKNGEEIARVFELHPLVAKNCGVEGAKIAAFEINFTKLMQVEPKELKYKPVPKFPGITVDISVLIGKTHEIGSLQKAIQNTDKQLIKEVKLFDIYEGPNIPPDKKALAFTIQFQADDRTLTDEESKKSQEKILAELKKLGGEVRGA